MVRGCCWRLVKRNPEQQRLLSFSPKAVQRWAAGSPLGFYHQCVSWSKKVAEALAITSMFQAERRQLEERTEEFWLSGHLSKSFLKAPLNDSHFISWATPLLREAGKQDLTAEPHWSCNMPGLLSVKEGGKNGDWVGN